MVIAVVAVIVVGPRDLPKMLRAFGNTVGRLRRMAGEFQGQFNEALREAELDDVRREIQGVRDLNPLKQIRDEVNAIANQAKQETQDAQKAMVAPVAVAAPAVSGVEPAPSSVASAPNGVVPVVAAEPERPLEAAGDIRAPH